jgi:hypothetical protein
MQFFRSAVFSRAMPILAICALAASFALGCTPPKDAKPRPVASKGVLDLRQWNFEKDGPIDLTGEWEFFWKQLLEPADFKTNSNSFPNSGAGLRPAPEKTPPPR